MVTKVMLPDLENDEGEEYQFVVQLTEHKGDIGISVLAVKEDSESVVYETIADLLVSGRQLKDSLSLLIGRKRHGS